MSKPVGLVSSTFPLMPVCESFLTPQEVAYLLRTSKAVRETVLGILTKLIDGAEETRAQYYHEVPNEPKTNSRWQRRVSWVMPSLPINYRWVMNRVATQNPINQPLLSCLLFNAEARVLSSAINAILRRSEDKKCKLQDLATGELFSHHNIEIQLARLYKNLSENEQANVCRYAAEKGEISFFKNLLDLSITISEKHRGWIVREAAENGHINIISLLLTDHIISDDHRGFAVEQAAENGHINIVALLLTDPNISDFHRGWAVWKAAQNGHINIIRLLLADHNISDDLRVLAVQEAAENGYRDIVALLRNRQ